MPYPSHIARNALRSALRNHRDSALVLSGRLVNTLSLADLKAALAAIGCDPDHIVADALSGGVAASNRAALAVDWYLHVYGDQPRVFGPFPSKRRCALITAPCTARTTRYEASQSKEPEAGTMEATALTKAMDELDAETSEVGLLTAIDPVETEVQTIRSLIATGGFSAFDDKLRELIIEARKPPITVEIMVPGPTVEVGPAGPGVHVAKLTGKSATWRALFGVSGALGKRETALWDGSHPNTPRVNDRYLWPHPQTETALTQVARGRNVMLYGPAGTGKTEFAQQLAARTGRPFALISCDLGTDAATLVGMTVPDAAGGVTAWQDGQLTRAIKTPGCVVCLDEPSVARPGALFVIQNVLANRVLFLWPRPARVSL